MELVFSDEFNTDGRTFYPGGSFPSIHSSAPNFIELLFIDDPYWEAVDLYYWSTGDLEWYVQCFGLFLSCSSKLLRAFVDRYDPEAITTLGGFLQITLSEKQTHNLSYQSGMMSSWNKFCFTGGILETSLVLPGANNVVGLWPAV